MSDIDEVQATINRAAHAQWRHNNPEVVRAKDRAYYEKTKERRRELRRRAVANLPPEVKAERAAYQKQWLKDHPEARKEHLRRYRERNKEGLARAAREYTSDPEVRQRIRIRTAVTLEAMAGRPRPEVCDACGGLPDPKKGLHFDHCHTSGNFRGWLCRGCNLALGNVSDDIQRLHRLIDYLNRAAAT